MVKKDLKNRYELAEMGLLGRIFGNNENTPMYLGMVVMLTFLIGAVLVQFSQASESKLTLEASLEKERQKISSYLHSNGLKLPYMIFYSDVTKPILTITSSHDLIWTKKDGIEVLIDDRKDLIKGRCGYE